MKDNNLELLGNIVRKAPWLIDGKETYASTSIQENACEVIDNIKNYHLTIITDTGRVYRQYLTITVDKGRMNIDKPYKWANSTTSFHVFFRSISNSWQFFHVDNAKPGVLAVSAKIPNKIYSLLKRRHRRIPAPSGTKVIFKNHNNMTNFMHVKNISEGGMLICGNSSVNKHPLNSMINEVFLTIPPDIEGEETSAAHRVLPFITKGKIVRTYQDLDSSISHYGISFQHENLNLSKRFNQVVSDFENHLR